VREPSPRPSSGLRGVGLGFRPELAADLLAEPSAVDFIEIVAEGCFVQPKLRDEALALARMWPIVVHGVKLSLGSGEGIDIEKARALGALARRLGSPIISEHVAFTRGREREIGHLTALPRTRAAVASLARNVALARRQLPDVPLLLENVAFTLQWPDDEMDEASFYQEVVAATDCDLLLDLGNLWANAINEGLDPLDVLRRYPLERVAMVHLAGGAWEDGFYFDTHAAPVGEPVLELLRELILRRGPVPTLIERDAEFGPFSQLCRELARVREIAATPERVAWTPGERSGWHSASRLASGPASGPDDALADHQAALALALTSLEAPAPAITERFGAPALTRSRAILRRKRFDDSLPLLPRTAALGAPARAIATSVIDTLPRAPRRTAIADAMQIAAAAAASPNAAAAGRLDQLVLRARFRGPDRHGLVHPRRGPFVGHVRLAGLAGLAGHSMWAFKGPGVGARVVLLQR
jgi:uncharacterized protein (UPF0276 family)